MGQSASGWDDFTPEQREQIERDLRARGIDPGTVKGVRREAAPPPGSASDLIDLASDSGTKDAIVRRTIEININGEKKTYSSLDDVPPDVRAIFDSIKQVADRQDQSGPASDQVAGLLPGHRTGTVVINTIETTRSTVGKDFPTDEIMALLRQSKKIEAIKVLRERTGMGLAEAKAAVDAIDATIAGKKQGMGCAGMIVLMVVVGAAAWAMV